MAADHLTFRRRNIRERQAIRLLRGEAIADIAANKRRCSKAANAIDETLPSYGSAHFGCLRHFCFRNQIEIRPLSSLYIADDELAVLRWLAEAQRSTGLRTCYISDLGLKTSLQHCAELLKELGVSLPTQTLYIYSRLYDRHSISGQQIAAGISPVVSAKSDAEALIE